MSAPDPTPRPRRRRLRRIVWTSLVVLVVLPALIAVGVVLALRASGVRQAILERISSMLAKDYGLAFTAGDFSPLWLRSGIELRKVRAGAPGAAPLATAERVEVVVALGSLRSRRLVVRSLVADGLRIDLAAPLPKIPESKPEAGAGPPVEIRKITLRRGEVLGAPLARPAADWVRSWSARGIEAKGVYRNGRLDLEVEKAEAILDRPGFGRQELRLVGRVGYEEKKPLEIDGLRVTGDGLKLAASGTVGLMPGEPTAARFEVDAEPRALVAGLPPRGQIHATGRIALPENAGQVSLTAKEIPAEALKPYLDPKLYADLALAGTAADLQAQAVLGPSDLTRVEGDGKIGWRRGSRTLARADVRVVSTEAVEAKVSADLLPGSPGKRSLQGTIHAASWKDMATATAESARAQVQLPDVRAALAEARSLWPRLIPAPPAGTPLQGSLTADVHLSGPLAAPTADLDATWLPQPGSRVRLGAKGQPLAWSGSARVQAEALPLELLAAFVPGLSGTVDGTVDLSGSRRGYRTRVAATTVALAVPPNLERLESGTVKADGTVVLSPFSYRGTVSVEGSGLIAPSASSTARLARFALTSDGTLRGQPLAYTGKISLTGEDAEVSGAGQAGRFTAVADGTLAGQPLTYDGKLSLDGTGVDIQGKARVDHLQLSAQGKGGADLRSLAARGRIDADRVALTDPATEIRNLRVEAEGDGREVRLSSFSGELPAGRTVSGSGRAVLQPLLSEADLDLHLVKPLDALAAADLTARLREGVVELDAPRLDTASGPASLKARVPLGSLRQIPQLAAALDAIPGQLATGPVTLSLAAPALDSEPLLAALGLEPRPERLRAGVSADLTLDLAAPAAGRSEVRLSGLTVETEEGRVIAEGPAVLRLAEGRLELPPVHLRIDGGALQGAGVDLQASADLARSWRLFEDPVASAVTRIAAQANGTIDAALLNPYLQGGAAAGSLTFSAQASGPPDELTAEVRASGPGASLVWPSPAARVTDPKIALDLKDGRWTIREGTMGVNGGTVDLAGGFSTPRGVDVEARLKRVRYRLDVTPGAGVDTLVSGQLAFRAPPKDRSRLSGKVVVERGVLDRDLNLDREVFTLLFKPRETPSTEASALAGIDLDLNVETADGVRVRNNVGDLRATWSRLTVGGTLEVPVIRGRIDVDPGGLFYAYGQTVRIDSGSLTFTGDPLTDPRIDLTTTTSLQDPTITRLRGQSPLDILEQQGGDEDRAASDTREVLAAGLTSYYGARVLARLSESVGLAGFSVRPVLVFNEADPSARLTVGRDLSRNVSLAVSVDLRNAERQTYLLYLQELSALPGLRIEGFTNDVGHQGGSLQQAFAFAGGGEGAAARRETGPRLRRIDVSTPKGGVSKREVRRAVRLEKKRPIPEGADFSVELDVADLLRRKRYPDPRITVTINPVEARPGWADVLVTVEPGPRVSFVFTGDKPPRTLRPEITTLYRTDFYEAASIEEMRKAAVRAFRSTGHLEPKVEIEVKRERPEDPDGPRTVTVHTQAGRRRSLDTLVIAGLPAEESRIVAAGFPGTLARAELAARRPDADTRLLGVLRGLGYPEARIVSRFLPADGDRLVVTVEAGPRQVLAAVRVVGEEGKDIRDIRDSRDGRDLLPLHAGDPARVDLISKGALNLEDDLRQRGYADATVRPSLQPVSDRPGEAELVYEVNPGKSYRLAGVEVAGERWSRPAPMVREAGLKVGGPFTSDGVEEARNRLFRTGVFSRVDAEVAKGEDGQARVTFSLAERPRFRLGYGVRYESSVGTAGVLDFVDQNFLGRALTLGLRGLYQEDDRSGRVYLRTGAVLGTQISLESYAEYRRRSSTDETDTTTFEDRQEISLQASRPFGERDTAQLYARYRTTRIFVEPENPFFPIEVRLPYVGAQLIHDSRNDLIDPVTGLLASLDLSGTGAFLDSDFQYARLFSQVSSFRKLALAGRPSTWAQSVRLGLLRSFGGQDLLRDELFLAGGPYSVRGYELESLGPQESFGDVDRAAGGEALFVLNEELRFALPFDLTGLAFFDAGQVWGRARDADFDLAKSIGLGLRAHTPVGLLRFDAAWPLDRRPGDERYKLYFGFGNAF